MKPLKILLTASLTVGLCLSASHANDLTILVEFIGLERAQAVELVTEHNKNANASDLRKAVQQLLDEEEAGAEMLDASFVRGRSGQRSKVEGIEELIYPSEFDPPHTAENLELEGVDTEVFATTLANPGAYETRNLGATLEVDPVIAADGQRIHLNLNPELVSLDRFESNELQDVDEPSPISNIRMPIFHTIRATTSIVVDDGTYGLAGLAPNPSKPGQMVFVFVRADILE